MSTEDFEAKYKDYIFIDEVGRGNIAGEMVFTGVMVTGDVSFASDSKQLTKAQREDLVDKIKNNVQHCTVVTGAQEIDEKGISASIKKSLEVIIMYFGNDKRYLYDGNKTFGVDHPHLETLVKADAKVKGVGAASIIAKHLKDALMLVHDKQYPEYGFKDNSGYATKMHIEAIKKYGLTPIHRKSFQVKELECDSTNANVLF